MPETPESLENLLRLHTDPDTPLPVVQRVSLADACAGQGDSHQIVAYLGSLGIPVRCLDDLLRINSDTSEDDVHSFRVREGVAVSVASHGAWVLFTP